MSRFAMLCASLLLPAAAGAQPSQPPFQTAGALVVIPAYGEVRHANDQAKLMLTIEEQDRDKSAAASRVNLKMKQGADIVRRQDPAAQLQTRDYYTYPVYPEGQPRSPGATPQPVGWRVGQTLEITTLNLAGLPATVAAAQRVLALRGLQFSLSDATARKLDEERIAATYRHLGERIAAVAQAMGRNPVDAVLDTVDFEASGAYAQQEAAPKLMRAASAMREPAPVEEPSFEPGETTLQMRAVGKVRFR